MVFRLELSMVGLSRAPRLGAHGEQSRFSWEGHSTIPIPPQLGPIRASSHNRTRNQYRSQNGRPSFA